VQFFGSILRNDDVVEFLSESGAFRTLVAFIEMPNRQTYCKMKYSAFGREILKQASIGFTNADIDFIRYINLTDVIVEFIELSRPNPLTKNDNVVNFLSELLITRRSDAEAERPKFASIIQSIIESNTNLGVLSQVGQTAVSRIFHKLVEIYPEDAHFRAHLARYLCYIEKAYDQATELMEEAIKLDSNTSEAQDPLLLHMKAMVYSAHITQRLIPEIKKQHSIAPEESAIEDELFADLKSNLKFAQEIFEQVREMHSGIAGHISDISLCLNVINLGKALDGTDTATFLDDHRDDWYLVLADRANSLFDDCQELKDELDDEDKERIKDARGQLSTIRDGISATITPYSNYLDEAPDYRPVYTPTSGKSICRTKY
jgi:tetratricopeptide (TPR) repeat protein